MSASAAAWRTRNPEKVRAHMLMTAAIRAGTLIRPTTCESCGKICTPHGHHEDYEKPLVVKWLCVVCHGHTRAPRGPRCVVAMRIKSSVVQKLRGLATSKGIGFSALLRDIIERAARRTA